MNKFLFISALLIAASLQTQADEKIFTKESAQKDKQIMFLSQIIKGQTTVPVALDGDFKGKKSMFSGLFGGDSQSEEWMGYATFKASVGTCYTPELLKTIKENGYGVKSLVGDGTIVAMREGTKLLKENGAQYIAFHMLSSNKDGIDEPDKIQADRKFDEFLQSAMQNPKSFPMVFGENDYVIHKRCGKSEFETKEMLWFIGQVAVNAIGLKGAASGNTNLTSLGAHGNAAVNNTYSLQKTEAENADGAKTFASAVRIRMSGIVDKEYFQKHSMKSKAIYGKKYYTTAYVFQIEEVEAILSKYMDIPYETNIKNN